ncbi:hypothetical protein ACGF3G_36070 [Streptomyces sp. NPDC048179]|uniref:hypothetical protein n=1 Tax=Streptomyces sp. NPDC048179 TaxID=3365506 RepID=UPI003718F5B7
MGSVLAMEMSWGQAQQWHWINDMQRDPGRWAVIGDVVASGCESQTALEDALRVLLADYELDLWAVAEAPAGEARLWQSPREVPVEWTDLRGSPAWAVHLIHTRFIHGYYEIDVHKAPIRLFGYTRQDGRFSVVAAISHVFADGAGLKGFARVLSDRLAGRQVPVASLSDVVLAQRAVRRRTAAPAAEVSDGFDTYHASDHWDRLQARESGELVFRAEKGSSVADSRAMTTSGTMVAALGCVWRTCLGADANAKVPLTLLHRLPSPITGRAYMGPGDVNILLSAPGPEADIVEEGAHVWRSVVTQSRKLLTDPPLEAGTEPWRAEQERFQRMLRLNVRANASELARKPASDRFSVHTSLNNGPCRALAEVAFTPQVVSISWDIPRVAAAQGEAETFGQLVLAKFLNAG